MTDSDRRRLILLAGAAAARFLDSDRTSKDCGTGHGGFRPGNTCGRRHSRGGRPKRTHQVPRKVHSADHRTLLGDQAKERRKLAREIKRERRGTPREHSREAHALGREQAREVAGMDRRHLRESEKLAERHAHALGRSKNPGATSRRHDAERTEQAESHVEERANLASEHAGYREQLAEDHTAHLSSERSGRLDEIRQLREYQRDAVRDEVQVERENRRDRRESRREEAEEGAEDAGKAVLAPTVTKDSPPLRDGPGDDDDSAPDHSEAENTYGLPEGEDIEAELRRIFREQLAEVLGSVPSIGDPLPRELPGLDGWDRPMADAMTPLISAYWDEAGKEIRSKIGLEPDAWPDSWRVTDHNVRKKIDQATLAFCRSTNQTTSSQLGNALESLRKELAEGIAGRGEGVRELTARVKSVFDHAETYRARRIAATEASRAYHDGQMASVDGSGVVQGIKWLVSANSCDFCKRIAAEVNQVKLGDDFAVAGDNPHYKNIRTAPAHPGCRCSVTYVLTPEFGGPEIPEWGKTLAAAEA